MVKAQSHGRGSAEGKAERAGRILDTAADLLLRWGYKRITIEDIATHAGIGKGTVYLHWRTKEALFGTLLLRAMVDVWQTVLQRLRANPAEVMLHRIMRSLMFDGLQRPLARALLTEDRELLGKLAEDSIGRVFHSRDMVLGEDFLLALRSHGLLRTDMDPDAQRYALQATVNGFLMLERTPAKSAHLPLEAKAEALARTVRLAFEPTEPPPIDALQDVAASAIRLLEQVCAACKQRMQQQMEL